LYYRLSVLSVELPPLRARPGDVERLTAHFLKRFRDPGGPAPHLTREAHEALACYPLPGNVRELENALRRAVAVSSNGLITLDCLPPEIAAGEGHGTSSGATMEQRLLADRPTMDELQRRYLQLVLEETGWNRRQAAAVLDLDRRTIQRLIARYKLHGAADPEGDDESETEEARPRDLA
jgi:DNA-binding NtrC family response regulator